MTSAPPTSPSSIALQKPVTLWTRLLRRLRTGLRVLVITHTCTLLLLLGAMEWWGERNWILSLLIFLPPQVFLLPLLILAPACILLWQPRLLIPQAIGLFVTAFGYMSHGWATVPETRQAGAITVVTHNMGQGNRKQFSEFVTAQAPDFVLLQDANVHGPQLARTRFPAYFFAGQREFYCISRFPIQQSVIRGAPSWEGRPVMARFEVDLRGQPLVLYNVHMPTPRAQFERFRGRSVFRDLLGGKGRPGGFRHYREWLAARLQLSQDVAAVLEAEASPFIVTGDFNMPDHGRDYRMFASRLVDSHAVAGRGWGLTFPGETKSPIAFHGPWLRLDYIFAGRGWKPVWCSTEHGRKSQHCAVVAHLLPIVP